MVWVLSNVGNFKTTHLTILIFPNKKIGSKYSIIIVVFSNDTNRWRGRQKRIP
jgi:hypothetical protein